MSEVEVVLILVDPILQNLQEVGCLEFFVEPYTLFLAVCMRNVIFIRYVECPETRTLRL